MAQFIRQEDPFDLYYFSYFLGKIVWLGRPRKKLSSFFDPFFAITKSSYQRDNSVIFFVSSYLKKRLRPRCWLILSFRCSNLKSGSVRPLKVYVSWVQTGVSQVGFYLWTFIFCFSTKGLSRVLMSCWQKIVCALGA